MSNDERIAILETTAQHTNSLLVSITEQLRHLSDRMDRRFDEMDRKFESKLDAINNRLWSNFLWLMSMIIGLAGLVAHALHWI